MTRVRVIHSETHNPWFNIATEEWIFKHLDDDGNGEKSETPETLYLWRNHDTVVIGRNQNPWSECNLARMEADQVSLARRTTGGGAVFHDLGNTCFTFLSPRRGYNRARNNAIILRALARFGIIATASGRNDIVVESADGPRKVSGSAFRETRDRAFHHGTLLICADLSRLENYLTPHPKKLESKGRASVRSRVTNLQELVADPARLTHETLCEAVREEFFAEHGSRCEIEILDPARLEAQPDLRSIYQKFASWDWRFGHAPQFKQQMVHYLSWGFVEVHLNSDNGHIRGAQIFSDGLFPDLIDELQTQLQNRPYTRAGVAAAAVDASARLPEHVDLIGEFAQWLATETEA